MLVGLTPARSAIIGTVTRSLPFSFTSSSTAVRTLWMTAALRPPVRLGASSSIVVPDM